MKRKCWKGLMAFAMAAVLMLTIHSGGLVAMAASVGTESAGLILDETSAMNTVVIIEEETPLILGIGDNGCWVHWGIVAMGVAYSVYAILRMVMNTRAMEEYAEV